MASIAGGHVGEVSQFAMLRLWVPFLPSCIERTKRPHITFPTRVCAQFEPIENSSVPWAQCLELVRSLRRASVPEKNQ
jgi:hypothetical protein